MAKIPNKNVLNGTTNPTTSQFKNEMSNLWEYINAPEFPGEVKLIGIGKISADKNGTGEYLPLTFHTGGAERMRIDTSGNVGIGSAPSAPLSLFHATNPYMALSNSTYTTYLNMTATDFHIYTDSGKPLRFGTNNTERLHIDSSGNVLVTSPAGLGYGTGAGGTVTQPTSKGTAVTLNKPTGKITMNNAALAAGATVSFILNNSVLGASDCLVMNTSTGGPIADAAAYNIWGFVSFDGVAVINVKNVSGASLSEAITINFSIIKGATA